MVKVEFNKKQENPFYGLKNCLSIFQGSGISYSLLNAAYAEVKDNKEKRELFYSLLFSIGDITNREHNAFHKQKVDSGGQARREEFFIIMNWIMVNNYDQFKKFLFAGLFDEYTCFDHLFRNRVKTSPKTNRVIGTYSMLTNEQYRHDLSDYVVSIINGNNPFKKQLVAKFLTLPRLGKRSGHKQMMQDTLKIMYAKALFLKEVSDKLGWDYTFTGYYANFRSYREWRKDYNADLESVLFSTGKIKEFDEMEFSKWLEKLPSQARFRTKNRILYSKNEDGSLKWGDCAKWYNTWEKAKEAAQAEQRVLQEKVRQGTASVEDQVRLKEVKKEARVNTGATTFKDLYDIILRGDVDKLKLESFVENKVNLPFNFLTVIDESGSMSGAPFNFAGFLASVLLYKNPDDDARNLIGLFANHAHFVSAIDKKGDDCVNSFWNRRSVASIAPEKFIIPEKSFYDNYQRIRKYLNAVFTGGGTNVAGLAEEVKRIYEHEPEILDYLRKYPIWCIISDGAFNNSSSAKTSLLELQHKCEHWLGFTPYIVIIDVGVRIDANTYADLDQVMYIPGKIEIIEQMLSNFKDIDVFDIFTPLLSIYRSNRYDLIRKNVI